MQYVKWPAEQFRELSSPPHFPFWRCRRFGKQAISGDRHHISTNLTFANRTIYGRLPEKMHEVRQLKPKKSHAKAKCGP